MAAPKTKLHLHHHRAAATSVLSPSNLVVATAMFAAGIIAGISAAPLLLPPTPPPAAPSTVAPAVPSPAPAMNEAAVRRYEGIVARTTADGLLVAMPDIATKDGKTRIVDVAVTPDTALDALVPNAPAEGAQPSAPQAPAAEGGPLPQPLPPQRNPYVQETRTLKDFKADDLVDFTTAGDPARDDRVTAATVTWIASMPAAGAAQGGPLGDHGAAPLPPPAK